MADRPILFSAPMVRALLNGRKTQTRRALNPQPAEGSRFAGIEPDGSWMFSKGCFYGKLKPRFAAGDRLYVREAIAHMPRTAYALPKMVNPTDSDMAAYYRADFDRSGKPAWKPGIHMPRWASRLTLTVTDVRVQRLQEISEADARAEGVPFTTIGSLRDYDPGGAFSAFSDGDLVFAEDEFERGGMDGGFDRSARKIFSHIWDRINASRRFDWDSNPWVVAISFTVERRNIDQVPS